MDAHKDPDPKKIGPDPQHCLQPLSIAVNQERFLLMMGRSFHFWGKNKVFDFK